MFYKQNKIISQVKTFQRSRSLDLVKLSPSARTLGSVTFTVLQEVKDTLTNLANAPLKISVNEMKTNFMAVSKTSEIHKLCRK